jgi:outer membrane protein OmpA-like peptidoglycan-associated protein
VYRELGLIGTPARFDEVMDFTILKQLDKEGAFKHQQDTGRAAFAPTSYRKLSAEAPIVTQTIRINFYPNSANLYEPQHDDLGNILANTLYDPAVEATLEKVARLVGQYERAVIAIIGHTDSSMKDRGVRYEDVKQLSLERANAVKQALVKKYKFEPDKFAVEGKAWDEPADQDDALNQVLNRRVEIAVYPPEAK